ncbi:MAG: right-handed parallel beta-helix repeat-containing protein [Planctomycetes bacterium]|nr:right-handed parallel beta-helix repeat-containing protein [Planctomycetota bacterium]
MLGRARGNSGWSRRGGRRRSGRRSSAAVAIPFRRRLRFEPLEDRRLLANVTVSNTNDVVDGNVTSIAALIGTPGADGISLREATLAANADAAADTIDFSVTGTIQLTNVGHVGEIAITNNLTINGPGANLLTIQAFAGTGAVGDGARIFNVDDGNFGTLKDVAISGLTFSGGDPSGGSSNGGAISTIENLTVTSSTISGNTAVVGGGIAKIGSTGQLTISQSTIDANTARSTGGGISATGGSLNVSQSTVSNNSAPLGSGAGGGIWSSSTVTTIDSSTISGNGALIAGGVQQSGVGILMTITNSTISGNASQGDAAGVAALYGDVAIRHSTITGNRANSDNSGTGDGGGVFKTPTLSNVTIDHTIVAGNFRRVSTRSDVFGAVTARYSLVGDNTGATITNNGGNQIGTFSAPIDPLLGGLTDHGGPTHTHSLLADSPAIDAGDSAFSPPPTNDQRGGLFVRVAEGDGAGGARIDIGAYERQTLPPEFFVVDALIDENDGNFSPGDVSLREAIDATNGSDGADMITFAASLTSGGPATILLTQGELTIGESLTISGPGASLLTIDASGNDPTPTMDNGDGSRVFLIDDGAPLTLIDVEIQGLALTGGDVGGGDFFARRGGAIRSLENLTLIACTIIGNSAEAAGGGIFNSLFAFSEVSTIRVEDSTISGNSAASGGGIENSGASLSVVDSTISNNSGGGIQNSNSSMSVVGSTISNNSAVIGGGIKIHDSSLSVVESTITGNHTESDFFSGNGGGIWSSGSSLSVVDSTISGNSASGAFGWGGGIYHDEGFASPIVHPNLTITGSTITGNSAQRGGGIDHCGPNLDITTTTITSNSAQSGGGIYSRGSGIGISTVLVMNSTISGNMANGAGGGIYSGFNNQLTVRHSTISGNMANGAGGGIYSDENNPLTIRHSTITANKADADNNGDGRGGGLSPSSSSADLNHTIVAGNTRAAGTSDDADGSTLSSVLFSLIGNGTGVLITSTDAGSNRIGTSSAPIDPLLGPLADNGGPTMTHALLAGSPAMDAGQPGIFFNPAEFDQRGAPFTRVLDGDGIGGLRIDIGAFESPTVPPQLPGDYNLDEIVDAADHVVWRKLLGTSVAPPFSGADGDGDSSVDPGDYDVWQENFGEAIGAGSGGGAGGELRVESGELRAAEVRGRETRAQLGAVAGDLDSLAVSGWVPGGEWEFTSRRDAATVGESLRDSYGRSRLDGAQGVAARDRAFVAWLATQGLERLRQPAHGDDELFEAEPDESPSKAISDDVDAVFELLSIS